MIPAGKIRRYFSLLNFTDAFVTVIGIMKAIITLYGIYPDVVFGKGGYASFPTLVAARLLRIPVVIHESDSRPGKVNAWAAKFARYIAVSYPDAVEYIVKTAGKKIEGKIAFTGNPVRDGIRIPLSNGAAELLHTEEGIPAILVLGGSLGSAIKPVILFVTQPRYRQQLDVPGIAQRVIAERFADELAKAVAQAQRTARPAAPKTPA